MWHQNDGTPDPPFGEQPGRQTWRNGSFPVRKPEARLIGRQECIENGEDVPGQPAPNLLFGVDSRCWTDPPIGGGLGLGLAAGRLRVIGPAPLGLGRGLGNPAVPVGGLGLGGAGRGEVIAGGLILSGLDRGERRGGLILGGPQTGRRGGGTLLGGIGDGNLTPAAFLQTVAMFGTGTGTAAASGTWPAATKAGDFLVLGVAALGSAALPSLTAPASWQLVHQDVTGFMRCATYIIPNAPSQTTTGSFGATVTSGTVEIDGAGIEWRGVNHTAPTDRQVIRHGTTGNWATASTGTLGQAHEIGVAVICANNGGVISVSTGGTLERNQRGTTLSIAIADVLLSSTASISMTGLCALSPNWIANLATYTRP